MPIPGETALIAASVLASQGTLQIEVVIALAAAAAIVGDNIGYLIGRKGGRWLLERPGAVPATSARRCSRRGEPFFERHGPKAVFFGRFVLGLRVWASWLAGATHMPWRSFVVWNALGGIAWAMRRRHDRLRAGELRRRRARSLRPVRACGLVIAIVGVFMHRHRVRPRKASDRGRRRRSAASAPQTASRPFARAARRESEVGAVLRALRGCGLAARAPR